MKRFCSRSSILSFSLAGRWVLGDQSGELKGVVRPTCLPERSDVMESTSREGKVDSAPALLHWTVLYPCSALLRKDEGAAWYKSKSRRDRVQRLARVKLWVRRRGSQMDGLTICTSRRKLFRVEAAHSDPQQHAKVMCVGADPMCASFGSLSPSPHPRTPRRCDARHTIAAIALRYR